MPNCHFYDIHPFTFVDLTWPHVEVTFGDLGEVSHGICEIIPSYFGTSLWPYILHVLYLLDYQKLKILIAHTHNL